MLIENVLGKVSESCHRGETEIPETKLVIEVTLREFQNTNAFGKQTLKRREVKKL